MLKTAKINEKNIQKLLKTNLPLDLRVFFNNYLAHPVCFVCGNAKDNIAVTENEITCFNHSSPHIQTFADLNYSVYLPWKAIKDKLLFNVFEYLDEFKSDVIAETMHKYRALLRNLSENSITKKYQQFTSDYLTNRGIT